VTSFDFIILCMNIRKKVFVGKCRLWKLKEADNEIAFKRRMEVKDAMRSEADVEQIWDGLRQCIHGE